MATKRYRPHGDGSLYKRKDGRWEAKLTLPNGKRRSFYGKTKAEANRKRREAQDQIGRGLPVPPARLRLDKFLERWLDEVVEGRVSDESAHVYRKTVNLYLAPELGHRPLAQLTPDDVQAALNRLTDRNFAPSTVGLARNILAMALKTAERWGLVSRNVARLADPPADNREPTSVALAPEEARRLLAIVRTDPLGPALLLGLTTGLRSGEIRGVRWPDLDLDSPVPTLRLAVALKRRRQDQGGFYLGPTKGRRIRVVPLIPAVAQVLARHRTTHHEARLKAGGDWHNAWGLAFTETDGKPLYGYRLAQALNRCLDEAELSRMRVHDLRHTCSAILQALKVPSRVVADILGHSSTDITTGVYGHTYTESMIEATALLADALGLTPDRKHTDGESSSESSSELQASVGDD